jgi:hypothetical protein
LEPLLTVKWAFGSSVLAAELQSLAVLAAVPYITLTARWHLFVWGPTMGCLKNQGRYLLAGRNLAVPIAACTYAYNQPGNSPVCPM